MIKPHVLFRVDGGVNVGNGHLNRTLAIAQELIKRGWTITLVTYNKCPALKDWSNDGVNILYLTNSPGSVEDIHFTQKKIQLTKPDWVILDGYSFNETYQKAISSEEYILICLDDIADSTIYADVVINQNPGSEVRFKNSYPHVRKTLLGSSYTLLRKAIRELRDNRSADINQVLVTFGGDDRANLSLLVALELLKYDDDFRIKIIVASSEDDFEKAKCLEVKFPEKVSVTKPTAIAPLLCKTSVLLSAGGSTVLEAVFLGIPSVVITTANNQKPGIKFLDENGSIYYAGDGKNSIEYACSLAVELLNSIEKKTMLTKRSMELIDGKGVDRVIDIVEKMSYS